MADEDKFDAIVVGGGLAGLTAALTLAKGGAEVLLIERGNYCGAKNVTGGRIYTHTLEKVLPGFAEHAPLERRVTKERLSVDKSGRLETLEYAAGALPVPGVSYTVERGVFDKWLAQQAEDAGAELVCGILVEELIVENGRVCGVVAGEDRMEADVVILADGANSLLAQGAGFRADLTPETATVGVKEVLSLPSSEIEARFGLGAGEGLAWMFRGLAGGCDGFLYTNRESVSVGLTCPVSRVGLEDVSFPQLLEDFKNSGALAPLLAGARLAEYAAHLIPRYDAAPLPARYGDGWLLCGDAAGLAADPGYTLRGMDLAVESGRLAAETVLLAKNSGDFSAAVLADYDRALRESCVLRCVENSAAVRAAVDAGLPDEKELAKFAAETEAAK